MTTPEAMTNRLEACFRRVEAERMAGVPILNDALAVRAVGMREWHGHWLCVLSTPWFMNIVLIPLQSEDRQMAVGTKRSFAFPAGRFEFILGEEEALGQFWMCSLFSPMFEFADQESAEAAAAAALEELFEGAEETDADHEMAMIWRGEVPAAPAVEEQTDADGGDRGSEENPELSRRAFLTGKPSGARP